MRAEPVSGVGVLQINNCTGSRVKRFDRRLFLTAFMALGACGFAPVYGPGGAAEGMRGAIEVAAPGDREGYELVKRLEERLGQPAGARYALAYQIETRDEGLGVTPAQEITRVQVFGTITFALVDTQAGEEVLKDSVTSFTAYSAQGSTVSIASVERDAYRRLMVALADLMVTRLMATAPDWLE